MSISDSEKLDRILKAYVLEVQAWAGDEFKYAMARSYILEEKSGEDSAELVFVMRRKPRDFESLTKKIAKLTNKYRRKYRIALQPSFQWEEENGGGTITKTKNACSNVVNLPQSFTVMPGNSRNCFSSTGGVPFS